MEFLLTCLIILFILKVVFNVSVGLLKGIVSFMLFIFILSIIPFSIVLLGLLIPIILFVAIIGFILKVIF